MQYSPKVPRPRPYNPTQMRRSVKRESTDWEPVSLRDRDVSWEFQLDHEEISEVRVRAEIVDDIELPPITAWVDMNLPLPVPRPSAQKRSMQ